MAQPLAKDYSVSKNDSNDVSGMKMDATMRPVFSAYNYDSKIAKK